MLRSTYEVEHVAFVFLCLGYTIQYDIFYFYLFTCKIHNSLQLSKIQWVDI